MALLDTHLHAILTLPEDDAHYSARWVILSHATLLDTATIPKPLTKLRPHEAVEQEYITHTLGTANWQISGIKGTAAFLA